MASTAAPTSSRNSLERALVALAAAAAFLPALRAGFLGWDDPIMALDPRLTLDAAGLRWMLTSVHTGLYQPVTWLSMAVDRALWGQRASGFHLTSLLLHAANAVLFLEVCRRVLRGSAGALAAALLFAAHPLGAESVAWVSERKGLLCAAFSLLSTLACLEGRPRWSAACFALALGAKATALGLPVVLLLLGARPAALAAHFTLAGAAGLLGAAVAHAPGGRPVLERLGMAAYGLAFYPRKLMLPWGLGPFYEVPKPFAPLWPAAALSAAACAGLWAAARGRPEARRALAAYAALIFPTLGLVSHGGQLTADRYGYLACLPLFALAGEALARARAAAVPVLLVLLGLSWRQASFWRDDLTLWTRSAAAWPASAVARTNLAVALSRAGRDAEAMESARQAARLDPDFGLAHDALGAALLRLDRPEEAAAELREAARLSPRRAADIRLSRAYFNWGNGLLKAGRPREARWRYETALRLDPSFEPAARNLRMVREAGRRRSAAR